jgi:hypothetical protein
LAITIESKITAVAMLALMLETNEAGCSSLLPCVRVLKTGEADCSLSLRCLRFCWKPTKPAARHRCLARPPRNLATHFLEVGNEPLASSISATPKSNQFSQVFSTSARKATVTSSRFRRFPAKAQATQRQRAISFAGFQHTHARQQRRAASFVGFEHKRKHRDSSDLAFDRDGQ